MSTLGDALRTGRHNAGLTQAQVSELTGINMPYLSKIENGRENPSELLLVRLAVALHMDPDELIFTSGKIPADVVELLCSEPITAAKWAKSYRAAVASVIAMRERTATRTTRA